MSKEIDTIKHIFSDKYINNSLDLIREEDEDMQRKIRRKSISDEDIVIYRLDQKGEDLFPYLKPHKSGGIKGIRRICDFAIFVTHNGVLYVLLIEMKKGKDSPQQQLILSTSLIEFIFKRAGLLNAISSKPLIRKIGVSNEPGKRTTADRGEIVYIDNYVKVYNGSFIWLEKFLH